GGSAPRFRSLALDGKHHAVGCQYVTHPTKRSPSPNGANSQSRSQPESLGVDHVEAIEAAQTARRQKIAKLEETEPVHRRETRVADELRTGGDAQTFITSFQAPRIPTIAWEIELVLVWAEHIRRTEIEHAAVPENPRRLVQAPFPILDMLQELRKQGNVAGPVPVGEFGSRSHVKLNLEPSRECPLSGNLDQRGVDVQPADSVPQR